MAYFLKSLQDRKQSFDDRLLKNPNSKKFDKFRKLLLPPMDRAADRLSFFLASGTTRVQLGTNTLKQIVDFRRY